MSVSLAKWVVSESVVEEEDAGYQTSWALNSSVESKHEYSREQEAREGIRGFKQRMLPRVSKGLARYILHSTRTQFEYKVEMFRRKLLWAIRRKLFAGRMCAVAVIYPNRRALLHHTNVCSDDWGTKRAGNIAKNGERFACSEHISPAAREEKTQGEKCPERRNVSLLTSYLPLAVSAEESLPLSASPFLSALGIASLGASDEFSHLWSGLAASWLRTDWSTYIVPSEKGSSWKASHACQWETFYPNSQ